MGQEQKVKNMNVIITRHGKTDWNKQHRTQGRTDIPLNEQGLMQANALAQRLAGKHIDAIYTSPLLRAKQTAEAVAKVCGAKVFADDALLERDFGIWEGMCFADITEQYRDDMLHWQNQPYTHRVQGSEDLCDILKRTTGLMERIKNRHASSDTILLVTHSIPARIMIAHFIGLDYNTIHQIRLDNASYTEFAYDAQDEFGMTLNKLITLNGTSHLQGLI